MRCTAWLRRLRDGELATPILIIVVPLLLTIAALPLLVARFPPLNDYPNHLARMYILAEYEKVSQFRSIYEIDWRIVPDLAMDVLVPPLAGVVGIEAAGLIFIFAIFVVIVAGALLVNKALYGQISIGSLFVFCILYNGILAWGFLNYLFGLGVSMIGFAIYIMCARKGVLFRITISSALSVVIFICHLYAFAVYGILVFCYELVTLISNLKEKDLRILLKNFVAAGVQAIIPSVIFVFFSPSASTGVIDVFDYGDLRRRLQGLSYVFGNFNPGIDLICYTSIAVLVGFLLGQRRIAMAKPALAALIVLCGLYLVMPAVIFGSSSADRRLIVAIALVAVAGVRVTTRSWRQLAPVSAVLLWVIALQVGIAERSWAAYDGRLANYLTAFQLLEEGSNMALAVDPEANFLPVSVRHVASLAVLERRVFSPNIFSTRGQVPVVLTEKYRRIADAVPRAELYNQLLGISETGSGEELARTIEGPLAPFKYLLVIHETSAAPKLARLGLQRIAYAPDFDLYRLR